MENKRPFIKEETKRLVKVQQRSWK